MQLQPVPRSCHCRTFPLRNPKTLQNFDRSGTSIVDRTGRLMWWSPAWGYSGETADIAGYGWLEFIHPDDSRRVAEWLADRSSDFVRFRTWSQTQYHTDWFEVEASKEEINGCCSVIVGRSVPIFLPPGQVA